MPNRSSKGPQNPDDEDENTRAFNIIRQATREDDEDPEPQQQEPQPGKNPAAVALGRLGGKKGGKARAQSLTPEQRSEIARLAAQARWKKAGDD